MSVPRNAGPSHSELAEEWIPERSSVPLPYKFQGAILVPQRYVVGWSDGVIKIGATKNGKRRWGKFIASGATLIDLSFYSRGQAHYAEDWLIHHVSNEYEQAFHCKEEAVPYLGRGGGGWTECFAVPVREWRCIAELASV